MAGKDNSVSPYLLRPLRTLEQVLAGRSSAAEREFEEVEGRQTRDGRDGLRETTVGEYWLVPSPTTD